MNKNFRMTKINRVLMGVFSATIITGSLMSAPAYAQVGTQSVVAINTNKQMSKDPVMFHVAGTNNVVVDLFGVDRSVNIPKEVANDPLVKSIVTKVVEDRVRMVIETKKPVKFYTETQNFVTKIVFVESDQFERVVKEAAPMVAQSTPVEKKDIAVSQEKSDDTRTSLTGVSAEERARIIAAVNASNRTQMTSNGPVQKNPAPAVSNGMVNPSVTPVNKVSVPMGLAFTEVVGINLKASANKVTTMTVDLSDKSISPVITRQGNKVIVDFNGVSIPNELQKRVSTTGLGTVTQSIDVSMQKNNGRIILEQKDNWDYSFYQMENKFVVDVKPTTNAAEAKKYTGKTLSLNFQDMEVRSILQVIADFTGLNIMSSDSVSGAMTIRLKDVPWDQALDLVLEARNLQKVQEGNVVWIATRQEITDNNKAKIELNAQSEDLEPLKLEFFQVNYYKANDLKDVLEGKTDSTTPGAGSVPTVRLLSKRGSIGVDPRNNMLFIQDTEPNLKELRKLVAKLDIPTRQVLIEAKIVIADDRFGKEIGAKFGIRNRTTTGGNVIGIGGNLTESGNVATGGGLVTPASDLAAAVGAGAIGITLLRASGNALGIELSALEKNNRGKVVSNPRLLTTDNKQALIEQGTEIPFVTPGTANSPATVTFKKAVLSLGVTPQIAPNGRVVMNLKIRKDTIGELVNVVGGGQVPSIDTKNIDTQVTVNSGQTVVLGGVYEIKTRNDVSKIPFFGDLPVIGNLFKNTNRGEEKGELLMFITPYVITEADLDEGLTSEIKELNMRKQ